MMHPTLVHFRSQQGLPEREELLNYTPEEAAHLMLRLVRKNSLAFIPGETVQAMSDGGYGRDEEVERVLMEGVAYLERYGLLVEDLRRYSGTGRGRVLSRQGKELAESESQLTGFMSGIKDPRALLHPDIIANALPIYDRGPRHFGTAVFAAFHCVEVAVRDATGLSDSDIGVNLMNRAFGSGGKLRRIDLDPGEEDGIRNLFGGAIGAFKNPSSHRKVAWNDSIGVLRSLMLASELLAIVDERAP